MSEIVSPTRTDPLARWASESIGGPAGSRIARPSHRWWTATRVLVLVAVLAVGLGLVQKNDCRERGWTSPHQFVHTCYSDLPVTYAVAGNSPAGVLGLGDNPDGAGQPPLSAYAMALAAAVTDVAVPLTGDEEDRGRVYLDVSAVGLALMAALMVIGLVGLTRRRPWDAALAAGAPVLVLSGLVSVDLMGVALGVLAVWMWSRERPVLAGLFLGLAISARWHTALILVALVLVSLRLPRWREVSTTLGVASVTWVVAGLPMMLLAPRAWSASLRAWWNAEPGYGSLWVIPRVARDEGFTGVRALTGPESTALSVIGLALVLVVVTLWVLSAPRTPRLPVVILALVVGSLLVAKAVPVQSAIWVLPWAALAVPRWRDHLWWWALEALYFVCTWEYLVRLTPDSANRSLPGGYYVAALVARLAVLAWLAGLAWYWSSRWQADPGRDPVDGRGRDDDPAAGAFARPPARVALEKEAPAGEPAAIS